MTQVTNHYLSWIDVDNEMHSEMLQPDQSPITLGRSDVAEVEVFNTSVSRLHLEFVWLAGAWHVKDLNSSFGTWIGNAKLQPDEVVALKQDTEIKLGNLSLWYEMRGEHETQEMFQTCFRPTTQNEEMEFSSEFNDFRVKLLFLLQENFGDNTLNVNLIKNIDSELHQLITAQEARLKEQRILNSISHILNRSLTLSELLKTSLNLVSKVLNAERGFVVLNHLNGKDHQFFALRHFDELVWSDDSGVEQDYSQALVKRCFEQNKILIIGDTEVNAALADVNSVKNGGGRSIVVIPLVQEDDVIGVIYLDNQQLPHNFTPEQIPFLTTFAAHTSIALHNSMLYRRAITDDLTQLYTRQHVDEALAEQIWQSQINKKPLSLLILDLDHFKRVNDNFGHTMGDQVLQGFSEIIKSQTRQHDVVGRFGGEEFVVILPNTDIFAAHELAERIRLATEKHPFTKGEESIWVTVSIGAASFQHHSDHNALLLLENADTALYQAKAQGRNQTVSFS
ncbi:diguanylate cyclase [Marinicella rhabdoformis]|uniref:diguanylate cyclase n=1 Tax=Marinicella rhabdoformis TaxID=2580566 RepID=UPI0015D01579|nr:diguanylate cyclase [Marinicella rhabdoformis]